MSLYNLDFSGWRAGNNAYASGLLNSETQMAKARAARQRGLESGIGTIVGGIIGGLAGGPAGAMKGASIGSTILGGGQMNASQIMSLAGGLGGAPNAAKKYGMATKYGDAVDPMQVASAGGNLDPTVFTR